MSNDNKPLYYSLSVALDEALKDGDKNFAFQIIRKTVKALADGPLPQDILEKLPAFCDENAFNPEFSKEVLGILSENARKSTVFNTDPALHSFMNLERIAKKYPG